VSARDGTPRLRVVDQSLCVLRRVEATRRLRAWPHNKCRECRRADAGRGKVRQPVELQEPAAPLAGSQATRSP
jgi:hypothetical protein